MIGHFLLTLTPTQEDRVLTRRMQPRSPFLDGGGACLLITAMYSANNAEPDRCAAAPHGWMFARHYDALCDRFGVERVNAAIRNRILANRARRVLAPVSLETVGQPQS